MTSTSNNMNIAVLSKWELEDDIKVIQDAPEGASWDSDDDIKIKQDAPSGAVPAKNKTEQNDKSTNEFPTLAVAATVKQTRKSLGGTGDMTRMNNTKTEIIASSRINQLRDQHCNKQGFSFSVNEQRTKAFNVMGSDDDIQKKLFKTRMCRSVGQKNKKGEPVKCIHGAKCRFAHNLDELKIADCFFNGHCRFVYQNKFGVWKNNGIKICNAKHHGESDSQYFIRIGMDKAAVGRPRKATPKTKQILGSVSPSYIAPVERVAKESGAWSEIAKRATKHTGTSSDIEILRTKVAFVSSGVQKGTVESQTQPITAGVILTNENDKVLLVLGTASGKWGFPKGMVEDGETPREGAVREIREETGHVVQLTNKHETWKHDSKQIYFMADMAADVVAELEPLDQDEIDDRKWFSHKDLHELNMHEMNRGLRFWIEHQDLILQKKKIEQEDHSSKVVEGDAETVLRVPIEMAMMALEMAMKSGKTNIRVEIV